MLVYNLVQSGSGSSKVYPGIYYNNGIQWLRVATEADTAFVHYSDSTSVFVTPTQLSFALAGKLSVTDTAQMLANYLAGADNGLSASGKAISLGGILTKPTTISTTATNTLSINGLQVGSASDSLLVVESATGALKKVSNTTLSSVSKISYSASAGQTVFSTPGPVTDINKINLYRNGIRVEVVAAPGNSVQLQSGVACDANDEIDIVQSQ